LLTWPMRPHCSAFRSSLASAVTTATQKARSEGLVQLHLQSIGRDIPV
jgi:hypothetical protein